MYGSIPDSASSSASSEQHLHNLIGLHNILTFLPFHPAITADTSAADGSIGPLLMHTNASAAQEAAVVDGVELHKYFLLDGWNLTLLEQQHLLHEANRRFGSGLLGNDHSACPSLDMPVGNAISMVLYAIVFVVGLVGNTLVIYVVVRFSKMQTVTNMYILNLAVADECFLIGIPFLIYTMQTGAWTLGKWACKAYMISTSVTQFTSSIFLFIMSADRYLAVCHPISATRYRSPFVSQVVSACAWLASALMMVPVFWFANTIERPQDDARNGGGAGATVATRSGGSSGAASAESSSAVRMTCNIEWSSEYEGSGFTFTLYSFVMGFAVPLALILCFYYLVLRRLRTVGPKARSKEKRRSRRKVTKLVLTVITVYVLCWLPYWISQVALISSAPEVCHSRLQVTMFVLVGCLGYSNSAMNPILYAFLSDNFKKSFMKACTCAVGKEMNAQLHVENSSMPRKRKAAELAFGGEEGANAGARGGSGRSAGGGGEVVETRCGNAGGRNATVGSCRVEIDGEAMRVGTVRAIFEDAAADISDSMQTKSTTMTTAETARSEMSSDRPAVLHTDF